MRVGKLSLKISKPWSPAARDPHYSRHTPDKIHARIDETNQPPGAGAEDELPRPLRTIQRRIAR